MVSAHRVLTPASLIHGAVTAAPKGTQLGPVEAGRKAGLGTHLPWASLSLLPASGLR